MERRGAKIKVNRASNRRHKRTPRGACVSRRANLLSRRIVFFTGAWRRLTFTAWASTQGSLVAAESRGAMDTSNSVETPILQIECPHCGDTETDDFEALTSDEVHKIPCAACREHFCLAIMDCEHCGAERLFRWMEPPPADVISRLHCGQCRRRYVHHEEARAETDAFL